MIPSKAFKVSKIKVFYKRYQAIYFMRGIEQQLILGALIRRQQIE